jgi:hypothetical protein
MKADFKKICFLTAKYTFCVQYLFFENRAVYETMWKNIVEPGRALTTIWRMRIANWIPKASNAYR